MKRLRNLLFAAAVVLASGCRDGDGVTGPNGRAPGAAPRHDEDVPVSADTVLVAPRRPTVFRPPLAPAAAVAGEFDAGLAPVVEVCAAADNACAAPVARFTTTSGPGSERVRVTGEQYIVNWHTRDFALAAGAFRIRVTVDGTETASQPVMLVSGPGDAVPAGYARVVNGRTLPIKFWVQKVRRLVVTRLDDGVEGTPADQDTLYAYGAEVPWRFTPAAGYDSAQVWLDGELVPASGTLRMDRDHAILLSADRRLVLNPEDRPLVESARAILTASDKPAAFQLHMDEVAALYDRVGSDEAHARIQAVEAAAYDLDRDREAIREAHRALDGHIFRIGGPGAPAAARFRASSAVAAAGAFQPKTTFYSINGILNTPTGAAEFNVEARRTISETGLPPSEVLHVYNSSFLFSDKLKATECFSSLFDGAFLFAIVKLPFKLGACFALIGYDLAAIIGDIGESGYQVARLYADLPVPAIPDSYHLADSVRAGLRRSDQVILLPHSQGNLLTQEAMEYLQRTEPRLQAGARACVGVVSLATPSSEHWGAAAMVSGIIQKRDIILHLPFPQYEPVETELSRDNAKKARSAYNKAKWTSIFTLGIGALPAYIIAGAYDLVLQGSMHGSTDSYLGVRGARGLVKDALVQEYGALPQVAGCPAAASVEISPSPIEVQPGQLLRISATVRDSLGRTLPGRAVGWSTSDSTVARLFRLPLSSETVIGIAPGTATITAAVEGVAGTAPVRVAGSVRTVEVSPATASLNVGGTVQLSAVAKDSAGTALTGRPVAWSSSDPSVAAVSSGGVVTAVGPGTAQVAARVDGVSGAATVTVASIAPPSDTLPVGAESSWRVDVPASGHARLSFDARIDFSSTAGNSTILEVTVNGTPVTSAQLVNKSSTYTYVNRGGTEPYYQNRGSSFGQAAPYWALFWSPDFSQNNDSSDFYYVAGGQPYTYVLDLSGLVTPGQPATVTLRNHAEWLRDLTGLSPTIVLRDVTLDTQ
jgi:hypothetical protein